MDMANSLHTSLLLSSGFIVGQGRTNLRAWRKQSSKWLIPSCLTPKNIEDEQCPPVGQLPHCLELVLQEDKRLALTAMMDFLGSRHNKFSKSRN
uniref:Uncharacterized protein n=1 Tax=Ditylenchus dipsaci TaxID=166011 RepID=A0A915E775_9BILA